MSFDQYSILAAAPSRDVYSVSRVTREVRQLLEKGLGVLWVEGELSNLSQPASGHWYFSLKDRASQLRCVMFRMKNSVVGFTPRSGMQVLVRGRIGVYEVRGDYQMQVEYLEEAGVGALKREFERLKTRLAAEGLFAPERKRALPRYPRRIGVITSPSGAALHDILHVLARRYPVAAVLIYPTAVQGAAAVPALVAALASASARAECDVLILARGGGSLEDLWAFNDERVARAIHACSLPLVCGVGHETDFSIADFVADARAPTPSGAAELAVPDGQACREVIARAVRRLSGTVARELRAHGVRLAATERRMRMAHPGVRLQQHMQRLDDLSQRLGRATRASLHQCNIRVTASVARLGRCSPQRVLGQLRASQQELAARLQHAGSARVALAAQRLALAQRALHAVSPLAILTRGFAVVTTGGGALVSDVAALAVGDEIEARLARGRLTARVTSKREDG
jgi:exodeoxyribonuclease VII large subunit